jgi:hypothetical protein
MEGTRREALKRGFLLIGAAVGVGTAGKAVVTGSRGEPSPAKVTGATTRQITLHGRRWHLSSSGLKAGQLPDRGQRLLGHGELVDGPDGEKVGEFFATTFGLDSPGRAGPDGIASLELHTFNLPGGSIIGTGTARAALDVDDVFAVVGGTGQFLGARGSYVARQQPQELGGDGTARFTFSLITEEVPGGNG